MVSWYVFQRAWAFPPQWLPNEARVPSLLIWFCWLHAAFLGRCCIFLANLSSLACPFYLWLHPRSFMYHLPESCLRVSWHFDKLSGFPGLRLRCVWEPPWPCNSYMLHTSKTSVEWMTGRFVPICVLVRPLLGHICDDLIIWVTEKWNK